MDSLTELLARLCKWCVSIGKALKSKMFGICMTVGQGSVQATQVPSHQSWNLLCTQGHYHAWTMQEGNCNEGNCKAKAIESFQLCDNNLGKAHIWV